MNIGKIIIEGALNGAGLVLGTMILGGALAFLSHNWIIVLLASALVALILPGTKKYRQRAEQ